MSTLYTDNIRANNASQITIPSGQTLYAPGHVINIQSANFTGTMQESSNSFADITNLSITMTPASASSKFLISCAIAASATFNFSFLRIVRNGTQIVQNDSVGNRSTGHFGFQSFDSNDAGWDMRYLPAQLLDAPNTASNVTYKVQFCSRSDTGVAYINRTPRDLNNSNGYDARGISTLTVMEIAQ